jgi:NAD(P)-dependent dehydrogenase (short-subunit alcohol dehydrogenase family)
MTQATDSMLGKRALVVGASAGIGREVGLVLAALGAQVAFHGRRRDKLEEAVKRAGSGFAVVADLCDPEGCESLVAEAADRLGGIDIIVHAASLSGLGLVRDTPASEWARVYAANVIGPAMVVRAALPRLSPHAVAAFLSSESVGAPYHGLVPYNSSKAALEEVVRGLRLEHPEHRFACIRVGQTTPTDFARDFSPELAGELLPKWIAIGRIPAQSMDVEEVGRAIAYSLAVAVTTPTVEFQDMVLRAPGGPFLGDASGMVEQVEATQKAVHGDGDGT